MDALTTHAKTQQAVAQAVAPFDWRKTAWRATRAAIVALGAVMVDAAVTAGTEVLADPDRLAVVLGGGPRAKALAGVAVFFGAGAAVRNWWKNRHRVDRVANTTP